MEQSVQPNPWMILPFGLLLTTIALAPLCFAGWWQKHYPKVAFALGAVTLLYYLVALNQHGRVVSTAREYFSFIVLIVLLFVVCFCILSFVNGDASAMLITYY